MLEHISFSALMDWKRCPLYHHYKWTLKEYPDSISEHLYFGTAIHSACEMMMLEEYVCRAEGRKFQFDEEKYKTKFRTEFIALINEHIKEPDHDLIDSMIVSGEDIIPNILPAIKAQFGDYQVIGTEIQLYEPLNYPEKGIFSKFKGFIDLVIKTNDGKYHIIDWKTCSWGWDAETKNSVEKTYQLTLYKHFFSQKENLNTEDVKCYFVLLKKTAKKDKNVEVFEVKIGKKKIENALNLVKTALFLIERNYILPNFRGCTSGYENCSLMLTNKCGAKLKGKYE